SVSLLVVVLVALRPAHRPPLPRWVSGGLSVGALLVLLLVTAPPLPGDISEIGALEDLIHGAIPCFSMGLALGVPIYLWVRALDHEVTRLAALLAGASAGVTGNLALHLHCPNTQPAHILMGHFMVAVA